MFLKDLQISAENSMGGDSNLSAGMPEPEAGQTTAKEFSMDSIYASLGIVVKVDGRFAGEAVDGRVGKFNMMAITEIVNLVYGIREQDNGNEMGDGMISGADGDSRLTVTFMNELDEQISYELTFGKMKELSTGKSYVVTLEQWDQLEQWLQRNKMIPLPEETTAPEKDKG